MAAVVNYAARNSSEKLVLLMIANYADEDGISFPSQQRLAEDCSMSVDSVGRALKGLESGEQPAIARHPRRRTDGFRTSDQITILIMTSLRNLRSRTNGVTPQSADSILSQNDKPHSAECGVRSLRKNGHLTPQIAVAEPIRYTKVRSKKKESTKNRSATLAREVPAETYSGEFD